MSLKLIINPEAEADLSEARRWYEEKRAGLGDRFLMSVEAVFDRICRHPELHAIVYRDLRMALVRRFPYAVIYRVDDDQITVIAVYHARRNQRGWQLRA